jgi:hypothetical protein
MINPLEFGVAHARHVVNVRVQNKHFGRYRSPLAHESNVWSEPASPRFGVKRWVPRPYRPDGHERDLYHCVGDNRRHRGYWYIGRDGSSSDLSIGWPGADQ